MYSLINEEIEASDDDDDDDNDDDGGDNSKDDDNQDSKHINESTLKQNKIKAIVKSCKKVHLKKNTLIIFTIIIIQNKSFFFLSYAIYFLFRNLQSLIF
jgi:hypothetical protein